MPNINIDDAYILNETGAQVDKVTGLFTKDENTDAGEKAFAQLNIGTAGSNRNLLDNPFFTVNQRSASGTVSPSAYVADRWTVFSGSATAGTYPTINASSNIGQRIAFGLEAGKTYTFSVLLADGTIVSGTKTVTDPNTTISFISNSLVELDYFGSQSPKNIRIYNTSGAALGVKAVKLELGSVSTLANDAPPDYGEELRKCQYYFVRLHETANYGYFPVGFGAEQASSAIRMAIMTPTSLRRAPVTVSFSGTLNITGNGTRTTVTSMSILDVSDTAVLASVVPASMPANQHTYTLSFGAQAYIDLSADL